jgi:hypothetical protein
MGQLSAANGKAVTSKGWVTAMGQLSAANGMAVASKDWATALGQHMGEVLWARVL